MEIGTQVYIKHVTYTVIGAVKLDVEKFPHRAAYISGAVYMVRGNGATVYSLPIDKHGLIPTNITPNNCGIFTQTDLEQLFKQE